MTRSLELASRPIPTTALWCVGIFALNLLLRLLTLNFPAEVVFDEVHFGKFISAYCCTKAHIFDVHPPHTKIFYGFIAKWLGYAGNLSFEKIGDPYPSTNIVWAIRLAPAVIGALIPAVCFKILQTLHVSIKLSLLGALAISFDNALMVHTRILVLDGFLILATLLAVLWSIQTAQSSRKRYAALAGIAAGCAVGAKFTGLVTFGAAGLAWLLWKWFEPKDQDFTPANRTAVLLAIYVAASLAIYILGWWVHFDQLTEPGHGDQWMTISGNFWQDFGTIHKTMLNAHVGLTANHSDGSYWWSWPTMQTTIYYWQGGKGQHIYLTGNPVVWWGSFTALIYLALEAVSYGYRRIKSASTLRTIKAEFSQDENRALVFSIGLYLGAFLPLALISRVLFLYHYLTPLIFAIFIACQFANLKTSQSVANRRRQNILLGSAAIAIVVGFIVISPMTFGYQAPESYWSAIFSAFPKWR